MCGFAGFFQPAGCFDQDGSAQALAMARRLVHRGPDDEGVWVDGRAGIALAHRRLAIVDLSPAGHQPMRSACGRYVLAFNGEIYNHRDWRAELTAANAAPAWRGDSDTETLLAGVQAWGLEAALRKTVGMFALALWDRESRALTLARDRLGEKPLFLGWQGNTLLFGSELPALRAHPAFRAKQVGVNRQALAGLLRFGAIAAPMTIHEGIHKLPPGSWLTLTAANRTPRPRRYWQLTEVMAQGAKAPFDGTPEEAVDTLERLLGDSVSQQMVADVPLGAFLSGGVDSSTIVALMQSRSARPVRTFTVGFDDPPFDESAAARAVARHLGTDHTEIRLSARDALAVVPTLPGLYGEPFADPSQMPTVLVSQLARQQVTVALSGDAGDELFGGYSRYRSALALWRPWSRLSPGGRAAAAWALEAAQPQAWGQMAMAFKGVMPAGMQARARRWAAAGDRLHKAAHALRAGDAEDFYRRVLTQWPDIGSLAMPDAAIGERLGCRADTIGPAAWPGLDLPGTADAPFPWPGNLSGHPDETDAQAFVHHMMAADTLGYLPDHVLTKVDRAAMASSLETRVPLLSPAIVEFAWRLPMHLKRRGGVGKWVLRQVLARHVPAALVERPKQGFGVPLDAWLRGPLRPWAQDLLAPERLAREGHLRPEPIQRLWTQHQTGQHDWGFALWNVLMFQAWLGQQREEADSHARSTPPHPAESCLRRSA